jgi:hypothetical protein
MQKIKDTNTFINCSIASFNSRKAMVAPIPTKKLILDTEAVGGRGNEVRGVYLATSVSQRMDFHYHGKNSVYRIQRKNIKGGKGEPYLKKSVLFRGETVFGVL